MPYTIIQPPFTLRFREMSREERRAYNLWFFEVLPVRIAELARTVGQSPGFESWQPDGTPDSLNPLGEWLSKQVASRARTAEERREIERGSRFPIATPGQELTNRTFSLAIDVGMYVSQVFLREFPHLR